MGLGRLRACPILAWVGDAECGGGRREVMWIHNTELLEYKDLVELRKLIFKLVPDGHAYTCGEEGPATFPCSREKEHTGPHVACGTEQAYEIWEK